MGCRVWGDIVNLYGEREQCAAAAATSPIGFNTGECLQWATYLRSEIYGELLGAPVTWGRSDNS